MWEDISFSIYWAWFLAAFACLLVELLLVPTSGFLLCIAASSCLMGLLTLGVELSNTAMLSIFAALCVLTLSAWWFWLHKARQASPKDDVDTLTDLTGQLIGYVGPLTEAIHGGKGRMAVNDTTWSVTADQEYPAGALVKITSAKGIVLHVVAAE